jgi:hypothetical protein
MRYRSASGGLTGSLIGSAYFTTRKLEMGKRANGQGAVYLGGDCGGRANSRPRAASQFAKPDPEHLPRFLAGGGPPPNPAVDLRQRRAVSDQNWWEMDSETDDPSPEKIVDWIKDTYPDTIAASAMGATFFSLDESHWPNFATIVTTDEHDIGGPSKLSRLGVFRLNIATRKETFQRLVGGMDDPDYAALDLILPHPIYAKELWVCVLNPSRQTFQEQVKPLIAESHARLARARRRRSRSS